MYGTINNPATKDRGWSVEVALPLHKLAFNQLKTLNVPPRDGDFWRMDFSRVEYHITTVGDHYEKVPNVPVDNWVWSPIGVIDMHNPDRWGMLQFSTQAAGQAKPVVNPEWPLRESAMATYYAEHAYKAKHGSFTTNLKALPPFIPSWLNVGAKAIDGTCATGRVVATAAGGFEATFTDLAGSRASSVTDLRYLTVVHNSNARTPQGSKGITEGRAGAPALPSRALLAPSFVGTDWKKLTVRKVDMPALKTPTSVLVQVVGSSVNPVDWKIIEQRVFPGLPAAFPVRLHTHART